MQGKAITQDSILKASLGFFPIRELILFSASHPFPRQVWIIEKCDVFFSNGEDVFFLSVKICSPVARGSKNLQNICSMCKVSYLSVYIHYKTLFWPLDSVAKSLHPYKVRWRDLVWNVSKATLHGVCMYCPFPTNQWCFVVSYLAFSVYVFFALARPLVLRSDFLGWETKNKKQLPQGKHRVNTPSCAAPVQN